MRKRMMANTNAPDATRTAAQTLDSLMTQDTATGGDKWLDSSWKGAEVRTLGSTRLDSAPRDVTRLGLPRLRTA